ncbi:MAG: type II toxin-antitoxin system VapC family toxin [Haliscomenobacter sp.]|uniref:type II toxin-antitoxin system VapC family toxin n=1 Tax=Haliscomenobacter sp. TaxID=2717303 RepID=UPI0029BAA16B|nr:type II toxin-antitoxin system VapC family toxin [Haliscomenobacter sp.]MDX2068864.1 type II toxin-antitoxin system VapC family toxin [Haliscomenobacter sp.]
MASSGVVIDTSIFVEYLRSRNRPQTSLVNLPTNTVFYASAITVFELYSGATDVQKKLEIDTLLQEVLILPFNTATAQSAGLIYQDLRRKGKMIEVADILIAATALANGLPVKTLNIGHFQRISTLVVF